MSHMPREARQGRSCSLFISILISPLDRPALSGSHDCPSPTPAHGSSQPVKMCLSSATERNPVVASVPGSAFLAPATRTHRPSYSATKPWPPPVRLRRSKQSKRRTRAHISVPASPSLMVLQTRLPFRHLLPWSYQLADLRAPSSRSLWGCPLFPRMLPPHFS